VFMTTDSKINRKIVCRDFSKSFFDKHQLTGGLGNIFHNGKNAFPRRTVYAHFLLITKCGTTHTIFRRFARLNALEIIHPHYFVNKFVCILVSFNLHI
jgi:hypothetical protein